MHAETLAKHDLSLIVDIFRAAYGYEDEARSAKTKISDSRILSFTSNRQQDYQQALPSFPRRRLTFCGKRQRKVHGLSRRLSKAM